MLHVIVEKQNIKVFHALYTPPLLRDMCGEVVKVVTSDYKLTLLTWDHCG
jgi:hypothetical protein